MMQPRGNLHTPSEHSSNTTSAAVTRIATTTTTSTAAHPQSTRTPDRLDMNGKVLKDCYLNNL